MMVMVVVVLVAVVAFELMMSMVWGKENWYRACICVFVVKFVFVN